MYHTNSLTISKHGLTQLINSFHFAEEQNTPLSVALTLSWAKTANWTEALYAFHRERFLNNLTKWIRRQAVVPAYLWTAEISNTQGLHQHLLVASLDIDNDDVLIYFRQYPAIIVEPHRHAIALV